MVAYLLRAGENHILAALIFIKKVQKDLLELLNKTYPMDYTTIVNLKNNYKT